MKHLRTLALVLCSILLLLTASSCQSASGGKPKDLYTGTYAKHEPVLSKAEKITLGKLESAAGGFVMTVDGTKLAVYDMASQKTVVENTLPTESGDPVTLRAYEIDRARCFALCSRSDGVYKTVLYKADGTQMKAAESKLEQPLPETALDLLIFDGLIYRASGETLSEVSSISPLANHASKFEAKAADFYYDFGNFGFSVYNADGSFYDIYVFENADKTQHYLLANGNVLIQQQRTLPDDASKYDYSENGEKFQLKTYLWQVQKKAAKEISFAYRVSSIYPVTPEERAEATRESGITFAEKVANIAYLAPIKDNMLQTPVWALMDNSGSVTCNLSEQYKGLSDIPYPVAEGVFAYKTLGGQTFYIDGEGKQIRDISSVTLARGQYIVAGNKLYSASYSLLFDFGKEGYTLEAVYDASVILSKGTDYIRFNGTAKSSMSEIRSTDSVAFADGYYAVTAENGETTYYAPDGTSIYKSRTKLVSIHDCGNKLLFTDIEDGKTVYILFTLK